MWIAKFRMRHDCILGNRCRKFKVTIQGIAFSVFKEGKDIFSSSMLYLSGNESNIKKFFISLKNDSAVTKLEQKGNMGILIERSASRAVQFYNPRLIFVKPVIINEDGYEFWEIGSWEKSVVSEFVNNTKSHIEEFKLLKFHQMQINNVHFPRLMPNLTDKQREAVEIAIKEGYYENPRRIGLRELAKIMKISLSTYEQHLRASEQKLIPNSLTYSQ